MRALLDTHTFFWFIEDNPRLSATAKAVIVAHAQVEQIPLISVDTVLDSYAVRRLR